MESKYVDLVAVMFVQGDNPGDIGVQGMAQPTKMLNGPVGRHEYIVRVFTRSQLVETVGLGK